MERSEERRLGELSPFELKNRLVALAQHRGERMWMNAGRGNPNWVAIEPRAAALRVGEFALRESQAVGVAPGYGGLPRKRGIAQRLRAFMDEHPDAPGSALLQQGVALACERFGFEPDLLVAEWVDGVLGDHYPVPVRMLAHAEVLVRAHLVDELFGGDAEAGRLDLFAVEGASAGITYLLHSLVVAKLLLPGDRIALGVPIFTPYLEVPRLPEYRFDVVEVAQDESAQWRYPASEIEKLRDPRIRAFLAVNPSNPTAVAMDPATVDHVSAIVRDRPDLIVITDDVYAPFVAGFRSLAASTPRNAIVVYSFSKYWGATGLRLGVVGIHQSSVLDEQLSSGARPGSAASWDRYRSVSNAPERLKFIDRMVADSRAVGLNHTAGLSTPQQVQMTFFALEGLLDTTQARKQRAQEIVTARFERLFKGAGLNPPEQARLSHYYAAIDIPALARLRYGDEFAAWLLARFEPIDFVVRLAEERGIVLLDGGGFDAPKMSVRVSLANLPDDAYESIGRAIVELLAEYHSWWRAD